MNKFMFSIKNASQNKLFLTISCLLLGQFGIHRFLIRRRKSAIAMLLLGILGISQTWAFVDLILILTGKLKQSS